MLFEAWEQRIFLILNLSNEILFLRELEKMVCNIGPSGAYISVI